MQGLLLRLSETDAAASAMRVIAFYDMLLERRASPRALVQATAGLAQCVAGWRNSNGVVVRLAPSSAESRQLKGPPTPSAELEVADHGVVWLERQGGPEPFDELVLERLALVAGALSTTPIRREDARVQADDTRLLLDPTRSDDAQTATARALGLRVGRPVVLVALRHSTKRDPSVWARDVAEQCWQADRVQVTSEDGLAAVLIQQVVPYATIEDTLAEHIAGKESESGLESGLVAGVGTPQPVTQAHQSWNEAKVALRFAGATRTDVVASHLRLGSLTLLAHIPMSVLSDDRGVQAVAQLRAKPGGADQLRVLQAFCRTGSLRQASAELFLHHSTVASHLTRIGARANWDLNTSVGRLSALTSLYAEYLCNS
ncbi:helix-turn-helix domain-containing protein [Mycobacterium sp. 21AC1]|uniref:helix-turn-helix domain-containing protein n=1 Tax=[Mycobacterium] appelbergii TaxID=2939269 RepID=UPI002938DA20|nr:helix-turn-helix domain-containing protein [Mycobacterium sp. 21AC1]MDV3128453.1 helix-turn-helix domain-containing protein [Mycobacterium sp. 21AC1]